MTFVVSYFISIVCNLLLFLFVAQIVPSKLNLPKMILLDAIVSIFIIPKILYGIFSWGAIFLNLVAMVFMVAVPILFYQGKLWKRMVVFGWFFAIQFSSDAIVGTMFQVGIRFPADFALWKIEEFLSYGCTGIFVYITLSSLSLLAFRRIVLRRFHPFYLLFFLYPVSLLFFIYSFFFKLELNVWFWNIGVMLGVAAELSLLFYTINQEKKVELETELKSVRHMMELEQAHYQMVEERREELAKIRHDFNNHLAAIGRLVGLGENEDAQRLISRLGEDISRTKEAPYCCIPVVNAVLGEKEAECARQGIRLETELEILPESGIEILHLCSIFSNLMDNAIKGCIQSGAEEPAIRLASQLEGDYLFIKTENAAAPPGKEPAAGQGYGTKILAGIAQEYGGGYESFYEEGRYIAVVSLLL